jgi:glycosyltransferase 2 family protein
MGRPILKKIHLLNKENTETIATSSMSATAVPEERAKRRMNPWLKFGLRMGCTVVLFFFLVRSISWSAFLHQLHHMDVGGLLIGLIIGLFGVITSSYQWQSLLDAEHIHIDLRRLINLYLVGIAFNHFLPSGMGGDVVKAYYVGRDGQNTAGSASAVIMSRVTGFIGMMLVSSIALLLWPGSFSRKLIIAFILSCIAMCIALVIVYLCVSILPGRLSKRWVDKKLFATIINVGQTVHKSARQPHSIGAAIMFGVLFHVGAALNYYEYAQVLHVTVPFTFYLVAIPFVSLIAFLPISINGFGLRESAFVYIFSTVHVAVATSLLLALLMDVQVLLCGIIGGAIYLLMDGRKKGAIVAKVQLQAGAQAQ